MVDYKLALRICNRGPFIKNAFDDTVPGRNGVEGFWALEDKTLFIYFNWTDSKQDWITDFTFPKKTIPYNGTNPQIRIHRGFLGLYKRIRDYMHGLIKSHPDVEKIIVSGFSLGGAMAPICAVDLQYNFPNYEYEVYTFGGPRVGNYFFVKSYKKRLPNTYRFVYRRDLVALVPPRFLLFFHVAPKIRLGKKSLKLFNAKDHYPKGYIEELTKLAE